MKKCPPGVICVENFSMIILIFCLIIIIYLIHQNVKGHSEKIIIKNTQNPQRENVSNWIQNIPSWPYTNLQSDAFFNPFAPPLQDERYFIPPVLNTIYPNTFSNVNVSTNIGAVETTYRQLGILTPLNNSSKDNILPLMGRPLFVNRNKWQYYSLSNQHNNVKLPLSRAGKSCTNEYGCDKLYNGDTIYIEGANETFKVTIYDNDTIKYLPFF
jgi:hypothetical protein